MTIQASRPLQSETPMPRSTLRTVVVGAGEAGRALTRDLLHTPDFGLKPLGFLDDDRAKRGCVELPILGGLEDLLEVIHSFHIEAVVIAIPGLPAERFRQLARWAASAGVSVRYLPTFVEVLQRDMAGSDLRSLDINRLIGRQEVHVVSRQVGEYITGRRVLVTGAGGSIGSELCRQVNGFSPSRLFMLDHDESNLHRLQLELSGEALLDDDGLVVADIRDRMRVDQIFRDLRPDVVFHAAAHKHLPLLERHPCEGVKSNVLGTQHVVRAACKYGAERFLLISTDKAADPVSVLGATKRLAELVVQASGTNGGKGRTRCAAVRFGNVLGSRGSLLPTLVEQMRSGGVVTVTHPDVARFFMTIEEAVGLVLEAGRMARGGEIFVLDMGEPVRIVDLVHAFARQVHSPSVKIRFTGLRAGEKLTEVLFSTTEECAPTEHQRIYATNSSAPTSQVFTELIGLYSAAGRNDTHRVRDLLARLLPGFAPNVAQPGAAAAAPYPDDF